MYLFSEQRWRTFYRSLFRALGKKLIIINIDYMGVGNRLKLLAIYDRSYGLDGATLYWNRKGWVNCSLGEIVDIDGVQGFREYAIRENPFVPPIITHPEKPTFWERGYWRFDVGDELPDSYLITRGDRTFPSIDFLYERTPEPYLSTYRAFFLRLKPSSAVRRRIEQVNVTREDVCVQVRNTVDEGDRANTPLLESYFERMRAFPDDTRFFISTLHESFTERFRAEFGGRIVELPNKDYRSMVDATADMYLLSMGHTLLPCAGSTFGEVAWWLGGGLQRVVEVPARPLFR